MRFEANIGGVLEDVAKNETELHHETLSSSGPLDLSV
jgi:hypothetical protein